MPLSNICNNLKFFIKVFFNFCHSLEWSEIVYQFNLLNLDLSYRYACIWQMFSFSSSFFKTSAPVNKDIMIPTKN